MGDKDQVWSQWLAERFETERSELRAVAYRVLGSASEADDAVQEAWLRLQRSDVTTVQNLRGWLITVVGRICLDMLRSRTTRREINAYLGLDTPHSHNALEDAREQAEIMRLLRTRPD
jgi:DNA-directed RNA polymerase specialized sigma24 family protein